MARIPMKHDGVDAIAYAENERALEFWKTRGWEKATDADVAAATKAAIDKAAAVQADDSDDGSAAKADGATKKGK